MKPGKYSIYSEFKKEFMQKWDVDRSPWIPVKIDLINYTPDGDRYACVYILENRYGKNKKLKCIPVFVDTDEKKLEIAQWYCDCISDLEENARAYCDSLNSLINEP